MLPCGFLLLAFSICVRAAEWNNASSTSSSADPTITAAPTWSDDPSWCPNDCTINGSLPSSYYWYPMAFNETITAATKIIIVNTKYNTTTTSIKLNELPSGYELPPVNAEGTHITTVNYTRSGETLTTTLAYPTDFLAWADGYEWQGRFQNSVPGQAHNECFVAPETTSVNYPSYPQPPVSMRTHPEAGVDSEGLFFLPTSVGGLVQFAQEYQTAVAQWTLCSHPLVPAPLAVAYTARFMTDTTTSYDDSKPTDIPEPANSAQNPAPSATEHSRVVEPQPSSEPRPSSGPEAPENSQTPANSQAPANSGNPAYTQAPANSEKPAKSQTPANSEAANPAASGTPQQTAPQEQIIPVGSQSVVVSSDGKTTALILPGGQTLEQGQTKTVDNTPIHLPTSGAAIIVGSATMTIALPPVPAVTAAPVVSIGSQAVPIMLTSLSTAGFVLGSSITILPGSSTVVDGTTYAIATSGNSLVVDGSTVSVNPTLSASAVVVGSKTIPINSVTAPAGPGFILPNGGTLLPGSSTTVDGTVVSMAPEGTAIVVGVSTIPVSNAASQTNESRTGTPSPTVTTTGGPGGYIWQGIGGNDNPPPNSGGARGAWVDVQLWAAMVYGYFSVVLLL